MIPPPIDPYDLGLEDVKNYPECAACRKKSDGAIRVTSDEKEIKPSAPIRGTLCGTHFDEWAVSMEHTSTVVGAFSLHTAYIMFVLRLRTERYAACWEVKKE